MKAFQSILLFLFLMSSINSCTNHYGLQKQQYIKTKEDAKAFWQWFEDNHTKIDSHAEGEELLAKQIGKFKQGIGVFLSAHEQNKELVISAGGNKELLPFIDVLYAYKQNTKGWNIVKYIQPRALPDSLTMEPISLKANDITLYADYKNESLLLIVELEEAQRSVVNYKILVQQYVVYSLGEENAMRHIHGIIFTHKDMIDDTFEAFGIHELSDVFHTYFPKAN